MTNDNELQYGKEPVLPSNGMATAAAMVGLLVCIPGTGLVALPLAIVGLRRAGRLNGIGRAPAMLGMVLALINLLVWTSMIAGAFQQHRMVKKSEPVIRATGQFVLLLGKGDLTQAKAFCGPDITDDQLETLQEQFGTTGLLQQTNPYHGGQVHVGGRDIEVWCELTFDTGKRVLITHWDPRQEPAKLFKFELMDAAATQPATLPSR